MLNILIVEDTALHFEIIFEAVEKDLGHLVEISPKNVIGREQNLNDQNFLIAYIQQKRFQEVLDFYCHIDLFIIDATLTPKSDKLGVEFLNFIQKNSKRRFNAVLISNTDEVVQLIDTRFFFFVSKMKYGIEDNFSIELIKTIKRIYKIGNSDLMPQRSVFELFKKSIELYGWKYSMHELWIFITENTQRRIIDKLILLLFYLLIIITVIYGGYNILHSVWRAFRDNTDETMILKIAEQIFLNLLPIFIVFGFFNYYKRNIRIFLLEGNTFSVDEDVSAKPMNVTKILFTSSIISYVIIKVIEEVFTDKSLDLLKLCSFGCLLAILMTYFIFLNKMKH